MVILVSTVTFVVSTFEDLQTDMKVVAVIEVVDTVTVVIFTVEYSLRRGLTTVVEYNNPMARLGCSPGKMKFFIQPMNFIDFISLLPFFISLIFVAFEEYGDIGKAGKIIRLMKVTVIFVIVIIIQLTSTVTVTSDIDVYPYATTKRRNSPVPRPGEAARCCGLLNPNKC